MGFSGGISRLSELIIDLFRTGEPGERRIEIDTAYGEDIADPNDLHRIKFIEEKVNEDTPSQIFSFVDSNPASNTPGRQRLQISSARASGHTPAVPRQQASLLLISDKVDPTFGSVDVTNPDTFASLDARIIDITAGVIPGKPGSINMRANDIRFEGKPDFKNGRRKYGKRIYDAFVWGAAPTTPTVMMWVDCGTANHNRIAIINAGARFVSLHTMRFSLYRGDGVRVFGAAGGAPSDPTAWYSGTSNNTYSWSTPGPVLHHIPANSTGLVGIAADAHDSTSGVTWEHVAIDIDTFPVTSFPTSGVQYEFGF